MSGYRFTNTFMITVVFCIMLAAGLGVQQVSGQPAPPQPAVQKPKSLIIYYSRTGNTRAIAETFKEALQCDILEIKDLKDRSGFFGFIGGMIDVKKRPITEISPKEFNLKDYDLLLIGSPGWGMKFAPAITTFFNIADFTGKKVVLFCVTSARFKQASFDEYSKLISSKGGKVIDTFLIKTLWLDRNEMKGEAKKISNERAGKWMR